MKIELRKVQVYPRLSQETIAFNADLYLDGKKVGRAENDGHGGQTRVDGMPYPKFQEINAWVVANVPKETIDMGDGQAYVMEYDLPSYIDKLVEAYEQSRLDAKEAKRIAKADREAIAEFTAKGMRTLRWQCKTTRATTTRWLGVPANKSPEDVAKLASDKYTPKETSLKPVVTWEVIS